MSKKLLQEKKRLQALAEERKRVERDGKVYAKTNAELLIERMDEIDHEMDEIEDGMITEFEVLDSDEELSGVAEKVLEDLPVSAGNILANGISAIGDRASQRDTPAERSMRKTVNAFNAMFGKDLTEVEGWQFMALLKMCRGSQGDFHMDDYEDQASYSALAGEAAQEE